MELAPSTSFEPMTERFGFLYNKEPVSRRRHFSPTVRFSGSRWEPMAKTISCVGNLTLGRKLNITDRGHHQTARIRCFLGGSFTYNGVSGGFAPSTNFVYTIDATVTGQYGYWCSQPFFRR